MHLPVLLNEVIEYLRPQANKNYIDCTLGSGGHAEAILKKIGPRGKLLAIDLNQESLTLAKKRLAKYKNQIIFYQGNFANLKKIAYECNFHSVSGILFDLGLSSDLLTWEKFGFSFQTKGPLLMRYDGKKEGVITAEKVVNQYSVNALARIFWEFGQEKYAKQIAKKICEVRRLKPIQTTSDLVEIILKAVPTHYREKKIHPATRVFQALRIFVNDELENLKKALWQSKEVLERGGRIVCLSYHSLEDRIVKNFFRQEAKDCLCPKEFPVCRCSHQKWLKVITSKPILPRKEEIQKNPRARSVKMRVAERI